MPFFLIPSALGVCFFLVWVFIGGMILRDGQLAAQRDQDLDLTIFPLSVHRVARSASAGGTNGKRTGGQRVVRVAS